LEGFFMLVSGRVERLIFAGALPGNFLRGCALRAFGRAFAIRLPPWVSRARGLNGGTSFRVALNNKFRAKAVMVAVMLLQHVACAMLVYALTPRSG
jgi:hypothetical protein